MRSVAAALACVVLVACGLDVQGSLVDGAELASSDRTTSKGSDGAGAGSDGDSSTIDGGDVPVEGGTSASDASIAGPELTLTSTLAPASIDISAQGTLDWAHWGENGTGANRKAGVTSLISEYTYTNAPQVSPSTNNPTSFAWTNGTPRPDESGTTSHVFFKGLTTVTLEVPAKSTRRLAVFWFCLNRTRARFEASLSDGSVTPKIEEHERNDGAQGRRFAVEYRTPAPNVKLIVRWSMLTVVDPANTTVRISAVTLKDIP